MTAPNNSFKHERRLNLFHHSSILSDSVDLRRRATSIVIRHEHMSPFQQLWSDRASRYGLSVVIPFSLSLDGETLRAPVLLRQFGARNGMLLVTDYGQIAPYADRLVERGYGYSCLSEASEHEADDEDALVDMLRDWGWSGDGAPPPWLRDGAG